MDIQLFATDKELREFPENKTDSEDNTVPDMTLSPNSISLMASDLPRPHTDLPKFSSSLPVSKTKHRTRRSCRCKSRSNSKSPIGSCSVVQVNDCLASIQEKQLVVQLTNVAYLGQSFSHSLSQPVVAPPVVSQLGVDWSMQISLVVPSLHCCLSGCSMTWMHLPRPSLPKLSDMSTSTSRLAGPYQIKL